MTPSSLEKPHNTPPTTPVRIAQSNHLVNREAWDLKMSNVVPAWTPIKTCTIEFNVPEMKVKWLGVEKMEEFQNSVPNTPSGSKGSDL